MYGIYARTNTSTPSRSKFINPFSQQDLLLRLLVYLSCNLTGSDKALSIHAY